MTKNKLQRFAEMKRFPNVIEPAFEEVFGKDHAHKDRWHQAVFGNEHPIVLELGCGKGEYTVNLARKYPGCNFIGIDIKGARMWRGAKTALQEGLANVVFLRTRIDFINAFFAPDEVRELWITFPDPQPKKAKKRLVSTRFLSRYQQFLKDGSTIHLKTDNTEVFHYARQIVYVNSLALLWEESDVHASRKEELAEVQNIQTFYEKQFVEAGHKIKYLAFRLNTHKPLKEPPDEG